MTITRALCIRICSKFHRMSVLIVSTCMQKMNIGHRVRLGAVALQTQEKSLNRPKWGAARLSLGLYELEFAENSRKCRS